MDIWDNYENLIPGRHFGIVTLELIFGIITLKLKLIRATNMSYL